MRRSPDEHPLLAEIKALKADGLSMSQIGARLGKTKNAIIGICRRGGLSDAAASPLKSRARVWSDDDVAELRRMHAAGWGIHRLAAWFGCGQAAITARLRPPTLARGPGWPRPIVSAHAPAPETAPSPPMARMVPPACSAANEPAPPAPAPVVATPPARAAFSGKAGACQWPEGERGAYRFDCTDATLPGRPYCAAHCARAYVWPKADAVAA